MKITRQLKSKKPWRLVRPEGYMDGGLYADGGFYGDGECAFQVMRQSDFLRQYYPSGHIINDRTVYPDIMKEYDEPVYDSSGEPVLNDDGTQKMQHKIATEFIPRFAFPFQQLILVKQLIHATGNDIQFETTCANCSKDEEKNLLALREGWLQRDFEIYWYDFLRSVKKTGDGAIVCYFDTIDGEKQICAKVLSYSNGDTLYPHYKGNKLEVFARSFKDYDEEGQELTEWIEVWDESKYYLYKRALGDSQTIVDKIKGIFGLDGYTNVKEVPHGFPFIPVTYYRDEDGPCWIFSQDAIEGYELSFSQMAHNNEAYGFPIMHIGTEDGADINRDLSGSIKDIETGKDDKVEMLHANSSSENFMKQLDTLYKMIYELSFVVSPPDLKSGDLPAAALKILYSPAYEKAMDDAAKFQIPLNQLVRCFRYGYGVEQEKQIDFEDRNLHLKWWIKPYVHINWSTTITDLVQAVGAGFLSKQTASQRIPEYAVSGEWDIILREQKQKQEQDLLAAIKTKKAEADIAAQQQQQQNTEE